MKELLYHIFAFFCNLSGRLFPVKDRRAAFLSMHNEQMHDSLGAVRDEMKARGFETVTLTRRDLSPRRPLAVLRFFLVRARQLSTAKYIFLNDNFMPLGLLHLRDEQIVTQLWHAEGAFKKFGLSIDQPPAVRAREQAGNEKLTWVVCSSKQVVPIYAEAFGVKQSQVLPLGAPRVDALLRPGGEAEARAALEAQYPMLREKTLVLYAPTFRDDAAQNEELLRRIDMDAFRRSLGDSFALLLRLHPQIRPADRVLDGAVDVTDWPDATALVLSCDVLVTDYSSICMTAALLGKKTVFFAFDLPQYRKTRDFYFDYESYVPGAVADTFDELLTAIVSPADPEKAARFCNFNFDFCDSANTARVLDAIVKK